MEQIQTAILNSLLTILVAMIGFAFQWLKKFIDAKTDELKAKTNAKDFELIQSIAKTVVGAVEQIANNVTLSSAEKFAKADELLTQELAKQGFTLTDEAKKTLIESVVNGYNSLKK
jgi:hypothetical protein|nr:MAG TPA: holin [Caudoviricetes sp.]